MADFLLTTSLEKSPNALDTSTIEYKHFLPGVLMNQFFSRQQCNKLENLR